MKDRTPRARPLGSQEPRPILKHIPLHQIEPDPTQPRKDLGDLTELVASVKDRGVIQPITVSPNGSDNYLIVAGGRRFAAAKKAGLKEIPALIARVGSKQERLELQIIENLHREDLSPFDEAQSYRRLIDDFGMKQRELAATLSKSDAAISQTLKILELPKSLLQELQMSEVPLSKSVLLEIANENDPTRRSNLVALAKNGASVQQLRTIRYEKRSSTRSMKLDGATVTIRVHKLNAVLEDFMRALAEAGKKMGL